MVDQPTNSEIELDFGQFLQLAIGILATIVCLAAGSAAISCFFGEELKTVFGLRALVIAGTGAYGAYFCFSTISADSPRGRQVRNRLHRQLRILRIWYVRAKRV